MALSGVAFFMFAAHQSAREPFAMWFPLVALSLLVPGTIADRMAQPKKSGKAMQHQAMRLLAFVARECGQPDEVIKQLEQAATQHCLESLPPISPQPLAASKWGPCSGWTDVEYHTYTDLYNDLRSLDFMRDLKFFLPQQTDARHAVVGIESIRCVAASFPASDWFSAQEDKLNSLSNVTLSVPNTVEIARPKGLLPSYVRGLEGPMDAAVFAKQMCVGFPCRSSLVELLLIWLPLLLLRVLFFCLGAGACLLAWWIPPLRHGWSITLMLSLSAGLLVSGLFHSMTALITRAEALTKRFTKLKTLNATLCGQKVAAEHVLPVMRVEVPSDLLVWAEVHELCLARYSAMRLTMDVEVVAAAVLTLPMSTFSFDFMHALEHGLLYLIALTFLMAYVTGAVPYFVAGVLVNKEKVSSVRLLSHFALQGQVALQQPGLANPGQQQQIQRTVSMANQLYQRTRLDSSQDVKVLGVTLTTATALAIAATFSAFVAVSRKLLGL